MIGASQGIRVCVCVCARVCRGRPWTVGWARDPDHPAKGRNTVHSLWGLGARCLVAGRLGEAAL